MANADVSLLFGVLGEGSLSGESGSLIQSQLTQIMTALNKNPLKIKVALDTEAGGQRSWSSQLQAKLNSISTSGKFSIQISNLKLGTGAIADFKKQLNAVINTLNLDKGTTITLSSEGIGSVTSKLKEAATVADDATQRVAEFNVQMANLRAQSQNIKTGLGGLGTGDIEEERAQIASLTEQYRLWQIEVEKVRLQGATGNDERIASLEREGQAIRSNIDAIKAERAASQETIKTERDITTARRSAATLLTQMQNAEKSWSAARNGNSKESYKNIRSQIATLQEYLRQLESGKITVSDFNKQLSAIRTSFATSSNVIKQAGENTKTFSSHMGSLAGKFTSWLTVSQVIMQAYIALQRMVTAVIDVDTAMTELRKVTDETEETYNRFLDNAVVRAKELGATVSDTVTATADFARLGYNIGDASQLADAAIIYKNVGDGIEDISEASESIISTMQAFGVAAEDAMFIVDKFNEVGNNFAISSKGVGDALLRSASALAAGNNTLDESIALITTANTIVQNPDVVGTTMKTISMYLRAAKTEAEEAGESTEGMANSVSELRSELLALTGNKVDIQIDENTFKSTYQIIKELSEVWDELTDISQANILEMIGGKRNSNVVAALIENFGLAEDVMLDSANAAGSALAENEKYLDSINGKIAEFQATFQELSVTLIDSEFVKSVVEFGTGILNTVNSIAKLIDSIGGLNTILFASIGIIATIKAESIVTILTNIGSKVSKLGSDIAGTFTIFVDGFKSAKSAGANSLGAIGNGLRDVAGLASTAQIAVAGFFAVFTVISLIKNGIEEARQKTIELSEATIQESNAELDRINNLKESYSIYKQYANQLELTASEEKSLQSAIENITSAMEGKQTALSNLKAGTEEYTAALEKQIEKELEAQEIAAKERRHAASEKLMAESWSGWDGSQITITVSDTAKDETDSYKLVQDIMGDFIDEGMVYGMAQEIEIEPIDWDSTQDVDAIVDYYYKLIELKDALVEADLMDTDDVYDIYGSVKNVISAIGPSVEEYVNAEYDAVYAAYEKMNGVVDTVEEFSGLRDYLNDELGDKFSFDGLPELIDNYLVGESGIFGEFLNELNSSSDAIDDATTTYEASLSSLSEVLQSLQSDYNLLATAEKEMLDGGLSASTIQSLADAEENYLDYLYEENGIIKLNTKAWEENSNAKMRSEIGEIQKEIDSLVEQNSVLQDNIAYYEEQRQLGNDGGLWSGLIADATQNIEENTQAIIENQGLLSLYTSLYGSITGDLTAYTSALSNFSNIANTVDSVSNSFQTLANLQAEVANGFTISLDKALEFASVYPEILNNAQASADGQIILNDGVVNSFIQGKKAELDAQIDSKISELEADKEVLEAKISAATAQLETAKNVGEGEGQIAREVAEYRIKASNEMVQALIDNGVEEAEAFRLAALSMSLNAEEFDRVAREVCVDVDGNFNSAAYNAAMGIYENMELAKTDINSVTEQAHEAAKAIDGIGKGTVQGKVGKKLGSGGGNKRKAIETNVTSGMFDGFDYDFDFSGASLDDFVSQVELDISAYEDAISQIDGQIAVLQALKDAPLKTFESEIGDTSRDIDNASKEVEEYIADIEDYREAIERLNRVQIERAALEERLSNTDDLHEKVAIEKQMLGVYEREQEALHILNNLRDQTISNGAEALRQLGFQVEYDPDNNRFFVENLEHLNELEATEQGEYESMQEATNALRQNTEDLINSLEDLNEANQEGSESWQELEYAIKEAKTNIIDNLKEIVTQASEAVDEIQNVYDTLKAAADEFAANGGFISVDAFQDIVDLGPEYMQYLRDENGLLVINEENINKVIAAKTQQLALDNAMSYVERLRLALQEESIEDLNTLLYATTDATNATWGLVYANLALLDLDDQQYAAALHNINAIRSLADNAVMGIGQVAGSASDELEDMKTGLDDILQYVMDMLEQRINNQIQALEDMKEAYRDIIDLRKEALDAAKEEDDYQESVADKVQQIAELQERINALSLDDSRDAQAQRAQLEEEMYDLQKELADEQSDYAIDAQKESLDDMADAYEEEKDKEIAILENSISSYQKLYDMAIDYIRNNWDTLYDELIAWNTEYGSVLNSEITTAWENCLAAAQRYGSYVSALNNIDADISAAQGESGSNNVIVGGSGKYDGPTNEDMVRAIVGRMKEYGAQWDASNSASTNDRLHKAAAAEAAKLPQYGVQVSFDPNSGIWWITKDELDPSNAGKQLHSVYHQGGVAGDNPTLKQNEVLSVLEKGEIILDEPKERELFRLIDFATKLSDKFSELIDSAGYDGVVGGAGDILPSTSDIAPINESTNNSVQFGNVYIYGANEETVAKHQEINRQFTNDILKQLNIRPR